MIDQQPNRKNVKRRILITTIIVAFFVIVGLFLVFLGTVGLKAVEHARNLQASITRAQDLVKKLDFLNAKIELDSAKTQLSDLEKITQSFQIIRHVPLLGYQYVAVETIEQSAAQTLSAMDILVEVAGDVTQLLKASGRDAKIKDISEADKLKMLDALSKSLPRIHGASAQLQLATNGLSKLDDHKLFPPITGVKYQLLDKLVPINEFMQKGATFIDILPSVLGYPKQKTYLFLLQNNLEVRATGGFIGNYGIIKLRNAEITEFKTDNVYNLDDPSKGKVKISPPEPFKRYFQNQHWFLRDSNWSPDFETSAKQAEWFYVREGGKEHLDGVISITPDFIIPFLRFTGPIKIDDVTFDADNFVSELEYQVEKGYYKKGIPEPQRKEIIGDLSHEMIKRIYGLSFDTWIDLLVSVQRVTQEKHLLLYFNDDKAQAFFKNLNWTGHIRDTDGDFLMVIDSNMASLKTDTVMDKNIDYTLREQQDGSILAQVDLNYKNNGSFTWFTTRYRDWVRVYAPLGSTLVNSDGLMVKELSPEKGKPEVGKEGNKTVFSGFVSIEPRESRKVTFVYRLPNQVAAQIKKGAYKLLVQKQSGVSSQQFKGMLYFQKPIELFSPLGFFNSKTGASSVQFISDLRVDRDFTVNF